MPTPAVREIKCSFRSRETLQVHAPTSCILFESSDDSTCTRNPAWRTDLARDPLRLMPPPLAATGGGTFCAGGRGGGASSNPPKSSSFPPPAGGGGLAPNPPNESASSPEPCRGGRGGAAASPNPPNASSPPPPSKPLKESCLLCAAGGGGCRRCCGGGAARGAARGFGFCRCGDGASSAWSSTFPLLPGGLLRRGAIHRSPSTIHHPPCAPTSLWSENKRTPS